MIQDILINSSNFGTSGRLYNRIRYLRKLNCAKNSENAETANSSTPFQHEGQKYSMDDLLYLKTVVISETNLDEVRKKLEITREHRDELVRKDTIDLMEHFPFFFTRPQLVTN